MKIETHLNPNCSEAIFTIVNWKKRQVLDTFDMQSDSGCGDEGWFVTSIDAYLREPGVDIVESRNDGNSYHPALIEAMRKFVDMGKTLQKDQDAIDEILNVDHGEDTDKTVAQFYMSPAEMLAKGYIKKEEVPGEIPKASGRKKSAL